ACRTRWTCRPGGRRAAFRLKLRTGIPMKASRALLIICLGAGGLAMAADPQVPMREPFTLTLHVDKDHYYEENIGAMPYVHEGGVYLMKGDRFGVSLAVTDDKLQGVSYQPDFEKA